ncbi:MAG: CPBP family intramembrane metalloprotease [Tannerella sp.]|nr:CPBP family intramembrane metalloprotease [Tannerella sp.]
MLFDDSHHFFLISIPQNTSLSIPQIDPYRYLLATLLIAPILEEITYRGFLQQYLINGKKPFWIIILVPALVFTISHIEKMTSWHIIFFVGILYGFIYYRFKNLTINILCHFLWNFLGITFVNQMTFNLYSIIIYCLSVILFTFIVIRIVRQIKRNISIEYENTEEMET